MDRHHQDLEAAPQPIEVPVPSNPLEVALFYIGIVLHTIRLHFGSGPRGRGVQQYVKARTAERTHDDPAGARCRTRARIDVASTFAHR